MAGSMAGGAPLASVLATAYLLLSVLPGGSSLDNGVGLKPALGWNSWNTFQANISEELIRATADQLVALGLAEAGYQYVILDDAWSEKERSPEGLLVADPKKFPSGMKALGDYIHSKGLKFGIYSDAGPLTCLSHPGSRGHEEADAKTWAEWGVDYLKYDNCWAKAEDWVVDRYTAMRDALNKTQRPILYSLCEWGVADPWLWAPQVGNSFRTTLDISANWESVMTNLDNSVGLARYAGPGAFNDPDMLEVGVGDKLTLNEQRAHFAVWALLKSPLLIGADLSRISGASLDILKARELIAVNQDELGVPGDLIWKQGPKEIYAAPLADGGRAVVFLNRHMFDTQYPIAKMSVRWDQLGYAPNTKLAVRDLWAKSDLGVFTEVLVAAVDIHDAVAVRLTPVGGSRMDDGWRPWQGQSMFEAHEEDVEALQRDCKVGLPAGAGKTTCLSTQHARHLAHAGTEAPFAHHLATLLLPLPTVEILLCYLLSFTVFSVVIVVWRAKRGAGKTY